MGSPFLLLFYCFVALEAVLPRVIFGRGRDGLLPVPLSNGDVYSNDSYMIQGSIQQANDHFTHGQGTWQQRYMYNTKFFNPQRPLAFLWIGGENYISNYWIQNENVSMMVWAQEFGAAAFEVEHRFYGPKNNTPFGDQTTDHLQLMTIDQALADINQFIGTMNQMYFSNYSNVGWITFGGSYAGTLSAYFRETYPNRTIGAVSTSSAVHFMTDYYGYATNTESTYRTTSDSCATNIGIGFQKMISLAYDGVGGRKILQQKFNLCDTFDDGTTTITKAVQYFFSNIWGIYQGIAQYTYDNFAAGIGLNVTGACQIMNNLSIPDEMDRVKAVWDWNNAFYGIDPSVCNSNNYTDYIRQLSDTSYSDKSIVINRGWMWQCCTQMGYMQTTDCNGGIWGSTVPLDFYADQCTALFGPTFTLDYTYAQVDIYRSKYYDNYSGTKVVFPNGSLDPWKSLGMFLNDPSRQVDSFLIEGTAHCADRYPARDDDPQSLIDARKRIHDHLANWISEAFPSS